MSSLNQSKILRDIIKLYKGKPPAQQSYYGPDATIYLTPDYLRGGAQPEQVKPSSNAVDVKGGETIVLWDGSNAGEIFRAKRGVLASTMTKVSHSEDYDSNYFFYALKGWEDYLKGQTSGSGIPHVDKEVFEKLSLIKFPKPEQSKIADVLSKVYQAIDETEALIAKQQRIKTGLMQDLLARGIDEHGNLRSEETHEFKDSPLGRIPVEWEVGGFENYVIHDAGIKPGPFGSNLTKDMYVEHGFRVYGQEQVIGGSLTIGDYYISERKYREMKGFSLQSGDVLISLVGTIGHVLIVPDIFQHGIINPRLLRFRPHLENCLPKFLKVLLLSQQNRLQLDTFSTGGTMPVLSGGTLRKVQVAILGIDEQIRITRILDKNEKKLKKYNETLDKFRFLKTGLMQDLLTGRVRVTPLLKKIGANS